MRKFDALIGDMQGLILRLSEEAGDPAKNAEAIKGLKIEIKALQLLHENLSMAARLAADIADIAGGAQPTLDQVITLSGLVGAYLPAAYRDLVEAGTIPAPPVIVNNNGVPSDASTGN